ncbi:MAG: iron ABC transporter substrate-binding protein [Desulfobacteraceae bacterium]|nr:iron ABC transporter substrate-binding protein [Desulfobacteraceae bacterium]
MKNISQYLLALILVLFFTTDLFAGDLRTIVDAAGRKVEIPKKIERVICSGPGCLRLLVYLQSQDKIVAVDNMEKRKSIFDARPYALANPQFKEYPLFGEFRGHDNPELIMGLEPFPQVIFKTYSSMGYDPVKLEKKTGIPVVVLNYGDMFKYRKDFFNAIRIIGKVMDKGERAEELIAFFKAQRKELEQRTANVTESEKKSCFVGGIAFKGPHGFQSTQPLYPPFLFINAKNVAALEKTGKSLSNSIISKESLVKWDPEILFLDLSTLQMGNDAGGLRELKTDPVYQTLTAVQKGNVFGVLPYNWYTRNFGSILADAWYAGKLLYPDKFSDLDPAKKADEIYTFLVGKPVFPLMNKAFQNMAFKKVPLN